MLLTNRTSNWRIDKPWKPIRSIENSHSHRLQRRNRIFSFNRNIFILQGVTKHFQTTCRVFLYYLIAKHKFFKRRKDIRLTQPQPTQPDMTFIDALITLSIVKNNYSLQTDSQPFHSANQQLSLALRCNSWSRDNMVYSYPFLSRISCASRSTLSRPVLLY